MNVETKEAEFKRGLAIILAIFTGCLGLLIYVAIYLDKVKKNYCIHCNSVCNAQLVNYQSNSNYQLISNSNQMTSQKAVIQTQLVEGLVKYCFSCGVELDQRGDAKYCRFCGTNIK
jgi:hypothetical protein